MTRYAYIDGNNNTYEIGDRLAYVPISQAESSSGTYSGGDPRSATLDAEQRAELIEMLDRIANDGPNVLATRPMGCGTVIIGDTRTYCRADSPLNTALEHRLRELLG